MLDLDKRRAEVEPKEVRLGGVDYTLPGELPLVFIEHIQRGDYRDAIGDLFGEKAVEAVAPLLAVEDFAALAKLYGVDLGEASASSNS